MSKSKTTPARPDAVHDAEPVFNGYTLEEVRYQRALMALRKEFSKSEVLRSVEGLRHPFRKSDTGGSTALTRIGNIASKVFSNMNVVEYALAAASVFGTGKKVFRMIKGKK